MRAHHQRGAVRWDVAKRLAPGIVLGSLIASMGVFAHLKGSYLAIFFGLFVGFSATQMLLNKKPKPSRQLPGTAGQVTAGGLIGFLSGLVGAGGAFISVPFMTWCNVNAHQAVATSAALGFPIAVANVAGYIVSGQGLDQLPAGSFGYLWRAQAAGDQAQKDLCQRALCAGRIHALGGTDQRLSRACRPVKQGRVRGCLRHPWPQRKAAESAEFGPAPSTLSFRGQIRNKKAAKRGFLSRKTLFSPVASA